MSRRVVFSIVAAVLLSVLPSGTQDEAGALRARAKAALSQISGELSVAGLDQPVEVIRDRWGVPHIYAKTVHDLFFAQGFVAAQDRLWQLDLWRRMAEGTLAEIVGPTAVNRDILARLLRYRGDMDAEWRAYRPDARAIVEAFVAGVNAQIHVATSAPGRLPIEFQLTDSRPGAWTPQVVIGRMAGFLMTRNARTEVQRARLARSVGAGRVPLFQPLDPPVPVTLPEGLDLEDIGDGILALANGVSETVTFPGRRGSAPTLIALGDPEEIGSNDWVIAGRHSATGKPLLANDPHRTLMLPSLRYTVHLNGPGWNVIGAGEPALPGVAAGHNDRVAFGFTIVGMDQQDLYVEQLDPSDHGRYRYRGEWEPVRVEREWIAVRGEAPREIALRFTRHGPVLHVDETRHRAYALRWVGTEPGAAGYLKSIALNTVSDWAGFRAAVSGWKVPSENIVYADVDGNIGWIAAGLAPVRPNWNGLLPVPGHEGRYEWSGFLGLDDLPQAYNPASGFIATANHNILPAGYRRLLGYEFGAPFRFGRILEVIGEGVRRSHRFSVADFERLQHDERSVLARSVCAALGRAQAGAEGRALETATPAGRDSYRRAVALLASWDGTLGRDSAAAALYETWLPLLSRALAAALTPEADRQYLPSLPAGRLFEVLVEAGLAEQPAWWNSWVDGTPGASTPPGGKPTSVEGRRGGAASGVQTDTIVRAVFLGPSLADAWHEVSAKLGPDPGKWAWGSLHRAAFEHPLALSPAEREFFNTPEAPRGGDGTTPNATGAGLRQSAGASFREVLDVGDWDRSTTINVPGLSGQPGSTHYADLFPLWAEGRYHPLAFSRAAVEQHAAERLVLRPSGATIR